MALSTKSRNATKRNTGTHCAGKEHAKKGEKAHTECRDKHLDLSAFYLGAFYIRARGEMHLAFLQVMQILDVSPK